MTFGLYNRDPSTLVMSTKNGGLCVKILKRSAVLEIPDTDTKGPPKEQEIPIPVPKKTKLYVDQIERERGSAGEMHRTFQRDLYKLRVEAAKNYVKTLTNALDPVSGGGGITIKLEIDVSLYYTFFLNQFLCPIIKIHFAFFIFFTNTFFYLLFPFIRFKD